MESMPCHAMDSFAHISLCIMIIDKYTNRYVIYNNNWLGLEQDFVTKVGMLRNVFQRFGFVQYHGRYCVPT